MTKLLVVDLGGTAIKLGYWQSGILTKLSPVPTPSTLDGYYQALVDAKQQVEQRYGAVDGVAISSPGAVNQKTGIIGGASAIPYIHNFPICQALEEHLAVPVTIENDANCAGLAECQFGAGRDGDSMLMLVIGSGIGGAVIFNNHIWHGAHLSGGEFGYMMAQHPASNGLTLSNMCSPVAMAKNFSQQVGRHYSGKEVFDLAVDGNASAQAAVHVLISNLASVIYNLQYSFDPDRIVIGGGVSRNPHLLPMLDQAGNAIRERITANELKVNGTKFDLIRPDLAVSQFHADGNLLGALVNYYQMRGLSEGELKQIPEVR
ncbi:ROK family protein [Limosilactobacillus sp.]|uniref:ROK family protein n=1 Tax=Limosilactobacillus sp. TaxID=2773925 RepID=UPI00345EA128